MKIGEVFGLPRAFPNQQSVWGMTAAQRALLLGPPKEQVKLLSTKDLQALSDKQGGI